MRYIACSAFVFGLFTVPLHADDACSPDAIHTLADVSVSDGLTYQVEGLFKSRHRAAARFIREEGSLHVVEGPNTWVQTANGEELAGDFQRDFALGHQFHAFFLRFNDVVDSVQSVSEIDFAGGKHSAMVGTRETGGLVYLINGLSSERPIGLRYDVGDLKIEITAGDWRTVYGVDVPFALSIDDGERIFEYRYQWVDFSEQPLSWFYDEIPAPDLDAVAVERLHRQILIAHCNGDSAAMASLTAPGAVIVSNGSVFSSGPEQTGQVFENTFERRSYSAYVDTRLPEVSVAASGDIGWAAVQVNAQGKTQADGQAFDEHWAWVMMARKIEGRWRMAGNASNIRRQP